MASEPSRIRARNPFYARIKRRRVPGCILSSLLNGESSLMASTSFSADSRFSFPVVRRRRDCTTMYPLPPLHPPPSPPFPALFSFFPSSIAFSRWGVDPFSFPFRLEYLPFPPPHLSFRCLNRPCRSDFVDESHLHSAYSWSREIKVRTGDGTRQRCPRGVGRRRRAASHPRRR